jgi:hypothetical protein
MPCPKPLYEPRCPQKPPTPSLHRPRGVCANRGRKCGGLPADLRGHLMNHWNRDARRNGDGGNEAMRRRQGLASQTILSARSLPSVPKNRVPRIFWDLSSAHFVFHFMAPGVIRRLQGSVIPAVSRAHLPMTFQALPPRLPNGSSGLSPADWVGGSRFGSLPNRGRPRGRLNIEE